MKKTRLRSCAQGRGVRRRTGGEGPVAPGCAARDVPLSAAAGAAESAACGEASAAKGGTGGAGRYSLERARLAKQP